MPKNAADARKAAAEAAMKVAEADLELQKEVEDTAVAEAKIAALRERDGDLHDVRGLAHPRARGDDRELAIVQATRRLVDVGEARVFGELEALLTHPAPGADGAGLGGLALRIAADQAARVETILAEHSPKIDMLSFMRDLVEAALVVQRVGDLVVSQVVARRELKVFVAHLGRRRRYVRHAACDRLGRRR